jgi:hypothetical protein
VPNDIPKDPHRSVCSRCGEEVRFGFRDGVKGWHHRESVDHIARHGHSVPYIAADAPVVIEEAPLRDGDDDEPVDPALQDAVVEVWSHPVDPDSFAPRSGIKQVINLIEKTDGWERRRLTHARGPYKGAKGQVLSISDTIVLGARCDLLDGSARIAVASWRDGKFDFAFIGIIKDGRLAPDKVDATTMKNWIKGTHDHEPLPLDTVSL